MKETVMHVIQWVCTTGFAAAIAFCWRLSYRLTRAEKDIQFLMQSDANLAEENRNQTEILLDIRDRLTRMEVVLHVKKDGYEV